MSRTFSFKKGWQGLPEWARAAIIVTITIALSIALLILVFGSLFGWFSGSESESKAYTPPIGTNYVAKIKVVGSISSASNVYYSSDAAYHHIWTLQTIDTLIADNNNKAIYLWLNTPGGTVYESDELYLKLMEYKEKTGRPVYAYMGNLAASGGYYAAAAADEIYANRNTWTGSIGVTLGTMFDVSGFLEKHGIETNTIVSGRNKAMGNYYDPLTDEQRAIYQSLVDEAYDQFVGVVALGRAMNDADVRELADGRIYTAAQALDAGLIDEIYGEKEAEAVVKEKTDGAYISDCYYKPDTYFSLFNTGSGFSIWDLLPFGSVRGGASDGQTVYEGDVAAVLDLVREAEEGGAPPIFYLYTG